jgi:hypothetical protein
MESTRREFLERLTTGAALMGVAPFTVNEMTRALGRSASASAAEDKWDLSWVNRVTGKHKAIFDVPEIDNGYGVWRASLYTGQYNQVLGVAPKDLSPVIVIRHNGIWLGLNQAFWDKYEVGKSKNALDPITQQPTTKNPVLLSSSRNEVPAMFDDVALDKFIGRGGIVLGCNVAFDEVVDTVKEKDKLGDEEARKRAISYLVPGVILQPSGVFAAIRAQEAGCVYLRAS